MKRGWKNCLLTGLSLVGFLIVAATQAGTPESNSSLVVVLDASGSMWGRIHDTPKVVIAKQVLAEILAGTPDSVKVGLVAYGHRRTGDCTDIETLAPLGTAPDEVASRVKAVSPRGKTPITEALRKAATLLSSRDKPSTLLLVSDGKETCKGDPCALARELNQHGAKLIIHTVGFGVGDETAAQLQCIAEAGGGNYYHAKDRAALFKALFSIQQAVAEQKPAPKPGPVETKPKQTTSKIIRLPGPGTIRLKPAPWVNMPPYQWRAANPETEDIVATVRERDELKVKSGEYQLVWRQSEHYSLDVPLTEVVTVPAGETVEVAIDTGLEIVVPEGMNPPYEWWLARPHETKPLARFRNMLGPQVVPAGTYQLGWHQNEHYAPKLDLGAVTIEAGKLNRRVVDSGFQLVLADWVPPRPYAIRLKSVDDKDGFEWRIEALGNRPLVAPPGVYEAFYRQSEHYHTPVPLGRITVPEHGFAEITINSGVKFKAQPETKPPYQVIFVPLDGGEEIVWEGKSRGTWEPIPIPPGRYRLDWWEDEHGTERMTILEEFTVEPGTLVEFEL